jgi:SAM-dependent methyltransferase
MNDEDSMADANDGEPDVPPAPAAGAGYVKAARFDWLTPFYDLLVVTLAREQQWKRQLVRQVALEPGMSVLDLGCGTGTLAIAMARAEPEATVVGLDGDVRILARARRKAAAASVGVEFVEGLAQEPPLPPGSFDAIVSSLLFHHLLPRDKEAVLARARELLRPGGGIHVADWGRPQDPLMRLLSLSVRILDGSASTRDSLAGALPSLLAAAGFADVRETGAWRTPIGTLRTVSASVPPD